MNKLEMLNKIDSLVLIKKKPNFFCLLHKSMTDFVLELHELC